MEAKETSTGIEAEAQPAAAPRSHDGTVAGKAVEPARDAAEAAREQEEPKAAPYLQNRELSGSRSTSACSTRAPTRRSPCSSG